MVYIVLHASRIQQSHWKSSQVFTFNLFLFSKTLISIILSPTTRYQSEVQCHATNLSRIFFIIGDQNRVLKKGSFCQFHGCWIRIRDLNAASVFCITAACVLYVSLTSEKTEKDNGCQSSWVNCRWYWLWLKFKLFLHRRKPGERDCRGLASSDGLPERFHLAEKRTTFNWEKFKYEEI